MGAHPRDVPVHKTFELHDVVDADEAVEEMVRTGFAVRDKGFLVLMPKDKRTAKRIGYRVTTGVSYGLRKKGDARDVRYWTYHHDKDHYGIVLVDRVVAERLGL